ncbi:MULTISPECIES: universal stress protein [Enterobacteriaceae]|uniref:Universal stress protein family n=1 Tax=Enterobacter cloacae TaxID=550 RepID=A0A144RW49_ENTCL|nr:MULTISPECIES: universal stress protein [Enterobacteriaceae]EAN6238803.1 universal stress protein [Salmonella enterica]EBL3777640.1 universal stress protein [Salmonella enterica subsp. enterica serovar Agona]EBZ1306283.1 universal stress protein [Salmonella enterica subsp. enterica serovar Enteritidis]EAN6239902.1 universal stress protein [Salmonella enterica]EAN8005725.1 universal stress protein [Salmonella enterica]
MNNTVIACVDGSPSTRSVCEYAAWAAGKLDVPLALMHVLEKNDPPAVSDLTGTIGIDSREQLTEELVRIEGERSRLMMAQGKAVLTDCAALLKQAGQPEVQLMQKNGALDEILAELGDIRLMVLGRRGSRNPVGSHLESVIRLQKRPVLVVPETYSTPSRVMFAYDGSEASRENLMRLTVSPLLSGLTCHLVMVNGEASTLQDAQAILQEAGIVTAAQRLEDKSVTGALCRYADENGIDLTVMGAYGHSRLRRFFIGSHTTEMLSESRQALLMLR